ncbi:CPBP family intramembrane glutamic endopeptidase [Bhargavaea beijingensis]|uniref:CPBP family intramembrane glutamic endopeptidase n=1 Tax=Bhargavaea beijingensis TaxID=426756 RepID=UPI0022258574|nr:CPBP family intramembrane glutamic endopeptidase [Bhargavaea beijingensis]MCW1928710.1 CPBP family intramembrane metalloprotease [Bhargavaea beijingensis]
MKRGLFIALTGIAVLLWVEQGLAVSYGWKTLAKIVLFLAVPLFVFRGEVRRFMAFRQTVARRIRIALWTGAGVMAALFSAYFLLSGWIDAEALTEDLAGRVGVTGGVYPFIALYILFGNSLLEEFFFRGVLPAQFRGYPRLGLTIPPLLFAVYHIAIFLPWFDLPILLLAVAGLWAGGVIFQLVNGRDGTILPSWIIHMAADLAILIIGAMMIYG